MTFRDLQDLQTVALSMIDPEQGEAGRGRDPGADRGGNPGQVAGTQVLGTQCESFQRVNNPSRPEFGAPTTDVYERWGSERPPAGRASHGRRNSRTEAPSLLKIESCGSKLRPGRITNAPEGDDLS